jgi:transposase
MTGIRTRRRDFTAMQQRRRRAARLFAGGRLSQAEVARELHVSRQSVSRWYEAWRRNVPDWIDGAGRAGRRPRLDEAQLKQLDQALQRGAQAHGFATALWTLRRVAKVIQRITGVGYHPGHVGRILTAMKLKPATASAAGWERKDEAWGAGWPNTGEKQENRATAKSADSLPGLKWPIGGAIGNEALRAESENPGID